MPARAHCSGCPITGEDVAAGLCVVGSRSIGLDTPMEGMRALKSKLSVRSEAFGRVVALCRRHIGLAVGAADGRVDVRMRHG